MAPTAIRSNSGFSLMEAMIAVMLLTVMMMWSLQGLMAVNRSVSANKIRQEAIKLGQELLVDARSEPYLGVSVPSPNPYNVQRQIASYDITYTVTATVIEEVPNISKSVAYNIVWTQGGKTHTYIARTLVSNHR